MKGKVYFVMDGRAVDEQGYDAATVMTIEGTLKEAIEVAPNYGDGNCIWEVDEDNDDRSINHKLVKIVY